MATNMIQATTVVSSARLMGLLQLAVLLGVLVSGRETATPSVTQDEEFCLFECTVTLHLDTREITCDPGGEWKCRPVLEWMFSTGFEGRR